MDAATTMIGLLSVDVMLLDGVDQTEAPPIGVHQPTENPRDYPMSTVVCHMLGRRTRYHSIVPQKNSLKDVPLRRQAPESCAAHMNEWN